MFTDFVKDLGVGKEGFVVGSFICCILIFLCIVHCRHFAICIVMCNTSSVQIAAVGVCDTHNASSVHCTLQHKQ